MHWSHSKVILGALDGKVAIITGSISGELRNTFDRAYEERATDHPQLPEAVAWLGAFWICLGDKAHGEILFAELDEHLFHLRIEGSISRLLPGSQGDRAC
jgi:hypothetical protein